MKTRLLTAAALVCCLSFGGAAFAQAPKKDEKKAPAPKSAADLAFDAFQKGRGDPSSKQPNGFSKVIGPGIAYLVAHPTHGQVNRVVNELGLFANTIDPKAAELRTSFLSSLKLEITNQKYKEGISDAARAAILALDAAVADSELRMGFNRDAMVNLREKIDALAELPAGSRFLRDREQSYAHVLMAYNQAPRAEEQLRKLSKHTDKGIVDMARQELVIIDAKKAPYDLKFTALDGKEVDFAQLRGSGKVVALYFWSSTNGNSTREFEGLKRLYSEYRKRGLEIVTVSYDKEQDREKLTKFVKENKVAWPVHFDGKQGKDQFAPKLNVTGVPRLLLFDKAGMLQTTIVNNMMTSNFLPLNVADVQIKRMLGLK